MTNSTDNLFANVMQNQIQAPEATEVAETAAPQVNELDMLKQRAKLMGISFSNNIGVDALRARIEAKLGEDAQSAESSNQVQQDPNVNQVEDPSTSQTETPLVADVSQAPAKITAEQIAAAMALLQSAGVSVGMPAPVMARPAVTSASAASLAAARKAQLRKELYAREMALVRVRIQNLDPKKKDLPGEILTFANSILGTVRKYVPFGEATDRGYHIPMCLYKLLKRRQFLNIKVRKDVRGRDIVEHNYVREFSLEVLDPLSPAELADLKAAQQAGGNID